VRSYQATVPVCECGAKDQVSRREPWEVNASVLPKMYMRLRRVSMKSWRQVLRIVLVVMLTVTALSLGACFSPAKTGGLTLKQPTVSPPTIGKAGSLRVGIDSSNSPFSGLRDGKIEGIDKDIAAALAEEMGLKLEIVDTKGQDVNQLLKSGTIDLVMGIRGDKASTFTEVKIGPYLMDGPAIFVIGFTSGSSAFDPDMLKGVKIVAQEASLSAYTVTQKYGADNIILFPSLDLAFSELSKGTYSYAAADAIVGSYVAVKKENIRCVGILGDKVGIYIGVASDKFELAQELTKAMQSLRDQGILKVVVSKWIGPLSAEVVVSGQAIISIGGLENPTP